MSYFITFSFGSGFGVLGLLLLLLLVKALIVRIILGRHILLCILLRSILLLNLLLRNYSTYHGRLLLHLRVLVWKRSKYIHVYIGVWTIASRGRLLHHGLHHIRITHLLGIILECIQGRGIVHIHGTSSLLVVRHLLNAWTSCALFGRFLLRNYLYLLFIRLVHWGLTTSRSLFLNFLLLFFIIFRVRR
jgi:hypothetical protein